MYTDVYFVVEKQPTACNQNPADGFILFTNITIAWEGVVAAAPAWEVRAWRGGVCCPILAHLTLPLRLCLCAQVHQFQPACNSQGQIISPSSVKFTWNTQ